MSLIFLWLFIQKMSIDTNIFRILLTSTQRTSTHSSFGNITLIVILITIISVLVSWLDVKISTIIILKAFSSLIKTKLLMTYGWWFTVSLVLKGKFGEFLRFSINSSITVGSCEYKIMECNNDGMWMFFLVYFGLELTNFTSNMWLRIYIICKIIL